MINAGLPLMEALKYLARQTPSKSLVEVILKIISLIERGKSFSFALAQFPDIFPSIFVSMIKSGEASGKLDKVLNDLAAQLESDNNLRSKIKSAMIYPAFILFAIAGVGVFALVYIIPQLESVFQDAGAELPVTTRALIATSHFLISFWYIVIVVVIALLVAYRFFSTTDTGKWVLAWISLNAPVFKTINSGIYITTFSKTLGLLMMGGVPIIKSLAMVSESLGNLIIEKELRGAVLQVERGIPLSEPLSKSKYFPPLVSSMVAVGEQTGQLDKILFNIAAIYEEETSNLLKGLTALVEPMIMLIVGVAVGILAVSIILPMYQLSNVS
jgi:type IV pilus assembly protein PilC